MPNWVYNRVHGSKKAVEMLVGPKGNVTFQKLLPVPPQLKALENYSGSDNSLIKALIEYVFNNDEDLLKKEFMSAKTTDTYNKFKDDALAKYPMKQLILCKELLDKYGCFDWYNWNCSVWGCKWDASSDEGTYNGDEEEITFETPWSPPEGVIREMANRFPDLEFVWHVDEESCAFSIDYIFNGDGTITEEDVPPEYYTPYIPEPDYLEDCGILDMTKLSDVKECIRDNLGDASFDLDKETLPDNKCNITLTVYDWEVNGGEELYSVTYNNLEDDENEES